jgi:hypothetical protein
MSVSLSNGLPLIVANSSRCIAAQWRQWVTAGHSEIQANHPAAHDASWA